MAVTAFLDLHLRADALDEAPAVLAAVLADTRAFDGSLGIKVMVFNGEVIGGKTETLARPPRRNDERRPDGGDRPNRRRPTARRRPGGE